MDERERAYFEWLASQVVGQEGKTYEELLLLLHSKEFVWLVANDDNRVQDGLDLRVEYLNAGGWVSVKEPCTVLEALVGLSRRLAFHTDGTAVGWAGQLLVNLELHTMYDPLTAKRAVRANDIIENLIWRNYNPDGSGGFFPLSWPETDQTKVELWYQMAAYVDEMHPDY
jgi:hypothetical protein